jgi:hypothetical protein
VSSVSPTNGSTGVSVNTTITANFNEAISSASVTTSTFQLRDAGNNLVNASVNTSGSQIILSPNSTLNASASYTVTITGGSSGVKDLAGNALVNNYNWSFTTGSGGGGGGTVTLFASSQHSGYSSFKRWSRYLCGYAFQNNAKRIYNRDTVL